MLHDAGADLSESGLEPPEIQPEAEDFWTAFWLLSDSRPAGMAGVAAIPIAEVLAYCQLHEVADGPELYRMIRAMDGAYINWAGKQVKTDGAERNQ